MRFYDAHAHLGDARLIGQTEAVLAMAQAGGVAGILATAAEIGDWPRVLALAGEPLVRGALGIHPWFVKDLPENWLATLEESLARPGMVAVGEIGLDFWQGRDDEPQQREIFAAQVRLAQRLGKPIILHNRRSWPECLEILRELAWSGPGLCHSFNADAAVLGKVLNLGLNVSFGGPLTRTNAAKLRELAKRVPIDRLLAESDAPDQPGAAHPAGPSLPSHVPEVYAALAETRGVALPEIAAALEMNYRRLTGG
jgi:TatD DNase family protein